MRIHRANPMLEAYRSKRAGMYRSTRDVVKQRIVIASNHKRFRLELSRLVQLLDPSVDVVGEGVTSFGTLVCSAELRPDLVLLDHSLRPGNALDLVAHIHRLSPDTQVMMISNEPDAGYRQAAIEVGALDYLDVLELTTTLPAALQLANRYAQSPGTSGEMPGPEPHPDTQSLPQLEPETNDEYHGVSHEPQDELLPP